MRYVIALVLALAASAASAGQTCTTSCQENYDIKTCQTSCF